MFIETNTGKNLVTLLRMHSDTFRWTGLSSSMQFEKKLIEMELAISQSTSHRCRIFSTSTTDRAPVAKARYLLVMTILSTFPCMYSFLTNNYCCIVSICCFFLFALKPSTPGLLSIRTSGSSISLFRPWIEDTLYSPALRPLSRISHTRPYLGKRQRYQQRIPLP